MRCYKAIRRVSAYMDNEPDGVVSRSVASHIEVCASCRKRLLEFEGVDMMVKGLPKLEVSPGFGKQLLSKVKSEGCK